MKCWVTENVSTSFLRIANTIGHNYLSYGIGTRESRLPCIVIPYHGRQGESRMKKRG
ncbi:hypothetical protein FHS81_001148 [Pseudochelatococcus contaminans]|uniref:Uncharacterized protein n=1 Tax=Pseudochelatococcus contaminans TaxID=1538103 RepID=A0A7W5Z2U0_9HYPH|nr:hypothetical protein [Pseudochelatococcus contaminans]